jgi:hypothetical protein
MTHILSYPKLILFLLNYIKKNNNFDVWNLHFDEAKSNPSYTSYIFLVYYNSTSNHWGVKLLLPIADHITKF